MPFRRNRWWVSALTAVLLLFAIGCPAANPPPAELDDRTDALPLTPYLSYLHDKSAVDSADDAWRLGFASQQGSLADAQALAARAGALAPLTQAGSKLGFDAQMHDPEAVGRYEAAFARAWASDDLTEGRRAFAERREPSFRGR